MEYVPVDAEHSLLVDLAHLRKLSRKWKEMPWASVREGRKEAPIP